MSAPLSDAELLVLAEEHGGLVPLMAGRTDPESRQLLEDARVRSAMAAEIIRLRAAVLRAGELALSLEHNHELMMRVIGVDLRKRLSGGAA